jgi:ribulose-phosphate 3-epimerase
MKKLLNIFNNTEILVAPSILAADFSDLGSEIKKIDKSGADLIHIDVMDGHFVPNISLGPPVIDKIRKTSELIFDVHLMISEPLKYCEAFSNAGADCITFHLESDDDTKEVINAIRNTGCSVGLSIKPGTPVEDLMPYMNMIDMVLIMCVEPGFGGQKFMADMMPKVKFLREYIQKKNLDVHIQVDGGIDENTVSNVINAGANILVAGTAVFRHPKGTEYAISILKK